MNCNSTTKLIFTAVNINFVVLLLFISVLLTSYAKFMETDVNNFYLSTPMELYEYMILPIYIIPQ